MSFSMIFSLFVHRFWDSNDKSNKSTPMRIRLILSLPALCDLITTSLNIFRLIYIDVSIYQMLRGTQNIFTEILSVICLKRRLQFYEIIGIIIITVALAIAGWASMYIPSSD